MLKAGHSFYWEGGGDASVFHALEYLAPGCSAAADSECRLPHPQCLDLPTFLCSVRLGGARRKFDYVMCTAVLEVRFFYSLGGTAVLHATDSSSLAAEPLTFPIHVIATRRCSSCESCDVTSRHFTVGADASSLRLAHGWTLSFTVDTV